MKDAVFVLSPAAVLIYAAVRAEKQRALPTKELQQ
jgi:hypothetical protein